MSLVTKIFFYALVLFVLLLILGGILVWKRPLAVYAWMSRHELKQAGLTKVFVDSSVGRQTVWQGGEGPTIVLLHGAGDQAGAWSKMVPDLLRGYRVVIPDLAGHSESSPAGGEPLRVGTILNGLKAVLDREPTKAPCILVGNSLGGWVAMLYALNEPGRVARLVIVNGGALRGEREDLTLTPSNREQARRLMDALRDPGSLRVPDFVLDDMIQQARTGPIGRLAATADDMQDYLLEGRLRDLSVPVDFLWGESDKLFTIDYARRMASQLPASRLTLIPRCGHVPQQECPSSFSAALQKLLQGPPPLPTKNP